MVRSSPLAHPAPDAVADAVADAVGRPVAGVEPIEAGLNAVYRVQFAEGSPPVAVCKVATIATDAEFLPEPRLLDWLAHRLPVPAVVATVGAPASPFDAAFSVTAHVPGRHVEDVLSLSPTARERLVAETGRHLAAVHDLTVADRVVAPGGRYGDIRVPSGDPSGDLVVCEALTGEADTGGSGAVRNPRPAPATWPARFDAVVDRVADGLAGETYTSGGEDRFADLAPTVRAAVASTTLPAEPSASLLHGDYRPANLVLAPDDADRLVRAVLDFGSPTTGDPCWDLALAADALVGVPLGGTDRGRRLRRRLREAYAAAREADVREAVGAGDGGGPDERYRTYRLVARAKRLGAFGYMSQFAREDDPDAVAARWRDRVRSLAASLTG